jgi:hypothetical protein
MLKVPRPCCAREHIQQLNMSWSVAASAELVMKGARKFGNIAGAKGKDWFRHGLSSVRADPFSDLSVAAGFRLGTG